MKTIINNLPDSYFESLGLPKPSIINSLTDRIRFIYVYKHIRPGSVLDIGAYFCDLLLMCRQAGHDISGTEVNAERVNFSNSILGEEVVVQSFRNGDLSNFSVDAFDNVSCLEVLEHVPDVELAVKELCRVSKSSVFITVPFEEKINHVLCVHCATYTPLSGHLHSFDSSSFEKLIPDGWYIHKQSTLMKRLTKQISNRLPSKNWLYAIIRIIDYFFPGKGSWLFVELRSSKEK